MMKIKTHKNRGEVMTKQDKKAVKDFRNNRKNKSNKWVVKD